MKVYSQRRGSSLIHWNRADGIDLDDAGVGHRMKGTNFELIDSSNTAELQPQDFVISCVKGNQLADAMSQLKPLVGENTLLVVLQVRSVCDVAAATHARHIYLA